MKKSLLLLIPAAGLVGLSFFNMKSTITKYHADGVTGVLNSVNPPAARTGAPGEANCTACHSGATMSAEGVVDFTLSGGPMYIPGTSYPITISTVGGGKNGFELTILDADGNQAGTFSAGANTSVTSAGGRQYIRHSASVGITSWTFDWTAPATESGELTAYYSFNKSNANGSTSGDEIFLGNTTVPSEFSGIAENPVDDAYNVFFNSNTRELNLAYSIFDNRRVVLNVQDLSGRLVQYFDLGQQAAGNYTEKLMVDQAENAGVYIVSLFVDNKVYNRKLMLN